MEEIVLVTSTRSWASVVFFEGRANGHISFGVRVHVDNDVRLVSLTRERSRRDRLRSCGPYIWYRSLRLLYRESSSVSSITPSTYGGVKLHF
jgi:hypothetical protein